MAPSKRHAGHLLSVVLAALSCAAAGERRLHGVVKKWGDRCMLSKTGEPFRDGDTSGRLVPSLINVENVQPWKGRHANQTAVLLGSGPTLDEYSHADVDEYGRQVVTFGTKRLVYWHGGPVDHLFVVDGGNKGKKRYSGGAYTPNKHAIDPFSCRQQKWFGFFPNEPDFGPPAEARARAGAVYFEAEGPCNKRVAWVKDVGQYNFAGTRSSIFFPLVFALYTGVSRIFIVGCDASDTGYSGGAQAGPAAEKVGRGFSRLVEAWLWIEEFVAREYPQVEVVLVNPRGLQGKTAWREITTAEGWTVFGAEASGQQQQSYRQDRVRAVAEREAERLVKERRAQKGTRHAARHRGAGSRHYGHTVQRRNFRSRHRTEARHTSMYA